MAVMQALGMIETKGLVASIEAADAMVKAANVFARRSQRLIIFLTARYYLLPLGNICSSER